MKKFILSAALIFAFGSYVTYAYLTNPTNAQQTETVATVPSNGSANLGTFPVSAANTSTAAGSAPPTATVQTVPTRAPTPAVPVAKTPSGQYIDGSYTGSVADAYYGNIQVKATISGGKLTNVTFLQYPSDRSTSRYINQQAMPQLKAEAIQAQSANVDGVSGASDSSAAFKQSLGSALSQAKA